MAWRGIMRGSVGRGKLTSPVTPYRRYRVVEAELLNELLTGSRDSCEASRSECGIGWFCKSMRNIRSEAVPKVIEVDGCRR